jgi:hypothetical protein
LTGHGKKGGSFEGEGVFISYHAPEDGNVRSIQHGSLDCLGGYGLKVRRGGLFLLGLGNSLGDRLELTG